MQRHSPARLSALVWFTGLAALALCVGGTGCVQRRMIVRSNPPGATVYVDDYEVGTTPAAVNFVYYGTRKIRLVKDGYETLTVMQDMPIPWHQYPPIDFVTENVLPGEVRDTREYSFTLTPQRVVPTDQLLGRAEQLRRGVSAGVVPGASQPAPPTGNPWPAATPAPAPARTLPPGATPATVPPGGETIPTPPPIGEQPLYPIPQTWPGR